MINLFFFMCVKKQMVTSAAFAQTDQQLNFQLHIQYIFYIFIPEETDRQTDRRTLYFLKSGKRDI